MLVHVSTTPLNLNSGEHIAQSFDQALILLRQAKGEKKLIIHGGTYYATNIKLTKADSGITIEAAGGEKPVLSGAIAVNKWIKDDKTGWFVADAPVINGKCADFRLLMTADGKRLKKARYPLKGRLQHNTVFTAAEWKGSHANGWGRALLDEELNHFEYKPEDIPEDFDPSSAEIQVFHSWNESYCRLKSINEKTHTIYLEPNCTYPPGSIGHSEYAIYNTKEGMQENGRWYCDRKNAKIYYRPEKDECVETFSCFVPVTTRIIEIEENVKDVTLKNLTLTAATTPIVNEAYQHPCQRGGAGFGVMEQDGAIYGINIDNVKVISCEVFKTGGFGIMLKGGKIQISDCVLSDCGAGGIGISSNLSIPQKNKNYAQLSFVKNCTIERIGLDYYSAAGIFSDNAIIKKNIIKNTPYTSIIANGDYCEVLDNVCINPMLVLNDGACIYMHINKDCLVKGNTCINENPPRPNYNLIFGIYLDSETFGYEICNNTFKGFDRTIMDAREGERNFFHDNFIEYIPLNGEVANTEIIFPILKTAEMNNNIFHCKKLTLRYNPEFFDFNRDFKNNKLLVDELTVKPYEEWTGPRADDGEIVTEYGSNKKLSF